MRIAVWYNLNSGGGKRALYDHVKGLVARGHTVVSYCADTVDQSYLPLSTLIEEKVYPLKKKLAKRRNRLKFLNSPDSIYEKLKAELQHCEECAADINSGNFDVLFANSSSLFSMGHIGRFVKIPRLIYLGEPYRFLYESGPYYVWRAPDPHSSGFFSYLLKRGVQLYKMYWYSIIVREEYISARAYNKILVNSFFSRESVKRTYLVDAKVSYLGIDTERFISNKSKKQNFVIGLGAINSNKGIEQSIDSIAIIDAAIRPQLIWIGNRKQSEYSEFLLRYAEERKVNILFKTNVTDPELFSYLSEALVMLYFPHLEPFGLAPLEANACGTAVISIKEGGIKETIVNGVNGFLVNDFDPEKIAGYINMFVSDSTYAEKIGESSRAYVLKNWNMQYGIDNIERYLFELAGQKKISDNIQYNTI